VGELLDQRAQMPSALVTADLVGPILDKTPLSLARRKSSPGAAQIAEQQVGALQGIDRTSRIPDGGGRLRISAVLWDRLRSHLFAHQLP
jgi:hypothetical protein